MALLLAITLILAISLFSLLRAGWPIAPGRATRLYAGLMTIHALINLVGIDGESGRPHVALAAAYGSALIYVAIYGIALWRNTRRSLLAAMALALGSYGALLILMAMGQFPFSLRIFAIASGVAAITLAAGWIARAPGGFVRQ